MAVLRRNCPHCPADSVAFTVSFAEHPPQRPHMWNCLAHCGACGQPICFEAVARGQDFSPPTNLQAEIEQAYVISPIWPDREPSSAPLHTPPQVAKRYIEGEDSFGRRKWNSAVAMYRSALDIATKDMRGVPKGTFFERLNWLHENHRITPDIWAWATHVRVEGNAALHDPEDFAEVDAKALRFFTEMFLRYVFELPGEVRTFRGEVEPKRPS